MIHYSLICAQGHAFEGCFKDSAAFDAQAARRLIGCPSCRSVEVVKAIMAPNVARAGRREDCDSPPARQDVALLDERQMALRAAIRDLREKISPRPRTWASAFPARRAG